MTPLQPNTMISLRNKKVIYIAVVNVTLDKTLLFEGRLFHY